MQRQRFIRLFRPLALMACLMVCEKVCADIHFIDVWQFRVLGVTQLNAAELQTALMPFTGPARTLDDLDKATAKIQLLYQEQGMPTVVVTVPEQEVHSGIIVIQVEETRVRRLRVVGSRYFSLAAIKKDIPHVQDKGVLNIKNLQAGIQQLNRRTADLRVVPSVDATERPGYVDVNLNVTDKRPLHGGLEMTNYHSSTTTPTRLGLDVRYANLWQKYHELSLQTQISPENTDEVNVGVLSYLAPIGHQNRLAGYLVSTDSDIAAIGDIRVFGKGKILGLRWVRPIVQKRQNVQSWSLGADLKDFKEDTFAQSVLSASSPIKYLTFSSLYSAQHNYAAGNDSFSMGLTWGLNDWVNDQQEFLVKRASADANFMYLKTSWQHAYYWPKNWELRHKVGLQLSHSPLVSNEQMSAGGMSSVRGYNESQITGDSGATLNLELHAPDLADSVKWFSVWDNYIFLEGAWVENNLPLLEEASHSDIAGFGLGSYVKAFEHLSITLDGAWALTDYPNASRSSSQANDESIQAGQFRLRASLRYDF